MIEAEELSVDLGRKQVLRDVRFAARPGAVTAIVGPNGSGKTTLMRALTAEVAAVGRIAINGLDPRRAQPWELAAIRAVLPQATPLAFPFTALEVVRLGLGAGLAAGRHDLARAMLARVGLGGYEARLYQQLSGGEQQRVQIARVLAQVAPEEGRGTGPRWLLLDEPVSSLDIGHQLMIMGIARDFADAGGGVVAVMHDLNLTAMFCDSVALLAEGRVLAQGAPAAILTDDNLSRAYRCSLRVNLAPPQGTWILPHVAAAGPGH